MSKTDCLAYSPATVATQLDCSVPFVYKLLYSGALPSIKVGRSRRILHDDLVTYLASLRGDAS